MNKLFYLFLLLFVFSFSINAQIRLDVEGDAQIIGNLNLDDGEQNIFIGFEAGENILMPDPNGTTTVPNDNVFMGFQSGKINVFGSKNTLIGAKADLTTNALNNAIAFGYNAKVACSNCAVIGGTGADIVKVGIGTTTPTERLHVEGDAKINGKIDILSSGGSVIIGKDAGLSTTGANNTFIGMDAGKNTTNSVQNTFIGSSTGLNNKGSNNTFIGGQSGNINQSGNRNTYIGSMTRSADINRSDAIAIGYDAQVECNHCAVIGGTGSNAVKVGIGTSTPTDQLHLIGENPRITVEADTGSFAGIRFKEGNGEYFAGVNNNHYVIFDNNASTSRIFIEDGTGEIGIGTGQPSAKLDINGNVRIRNIATSSSVSGSIVRIDANGRLFINTSAAKVVSENDTPNLIAEQKELINTKSREIDGLKIENEVQNETILDLEEKINGQQQQIEELKLLENKVTELKYLVEKLLNERAETPKNTRLILPLTPKAQLAQNQPNPFRENTLVHYFIPANVQQAHLQVTTFDGKVIGKVAISQMGKGQVTIQSKSYPAGTYFYSLVLDGQVMETKRMVLAR